MINSVITYINNHQLIPFGSKLVVGLSGGPDSVFLLHLLAQIRASHSISLIAAHLDHEWRVDSANDVSFCKAMAQRLAIPFVSSTISQLNIPFTKNGSQEALGRAARRFFLEHVMQEYEAHAIALAHHLQDQQETFFIRLIRGSSLTGLTAMKPKSGHYVRPLLETSKTDIFAYLHHHAIAYLTDPSNESPAYLRNRIRSKVLTAFQACDKRFDSNFLATMHRLQATEDYLEQETIGIYESITEQQLSTTYLRIPDLLHLHPIMQQRIIVYWLIKHLVPFTPSESLLQEIIRFLKQPGSKTHRIHTSWDLIKKNNRVTIQIHSD